MVTEIHPIASKYTESPLFSFVGTNLLTFSEIKITANNITFPVKPEDITNTSIQTELPIMQPGYHNIIIQCDDITYVFTIIRYIHDNELTISNGTNKTSKCDITLIEYENELDMYGSYIEIPVNPLATLFEIKTASTTNIVKNGLQTINGISLLVGDLIYLKNQSSSSDNGIWEVKEDNWIHITPNVEPHVLDFGAYASENGVDVSTKILKRIVFNPSIDGVGSITYYVMSKDHVLSHTQRRIRITNGDNLILSNPKDAIYDLRITNKSEFFSKKFNNYRYEFL